MKNIVLIIVLFISIVGMCFIKYNKNKIKNNEIQKHYNQYVITNKISNIYIKKNDQYIKIGKINSGEIIELSKEINEYFIIKNMDDKYYIKYEDVEKTKRKIQINDRYKKYIAFNENIISDSIELYQNDKMIYHIDKKMSLPIYIKDDNKYYVEYMNQLFYVKKNNVTVIEHQNTNLINTYGIGVLNYHFFYNDNSEIEKKECNQEICTSTTQLKTHLNYIKENSFFTPTMEELEKYIDGKLQLPKSVVITIDDGWRSKLGIELINKYQLNATLFLITAYYDPEKYKSKYIEVHSHTDDLHVGGKCLGGQGSGLKCLSESILLEDLKKSREKLNGTTVLCYPFYEYNDYSIRIAKKAGFTMAFAGERFYSDNLVKVGSNKFELPRFVIANYTKIKDIENYLN